MKKIVISFILVIFLFNIFYPAIYATENMLNEENVEIKEESVDQEDEEESELENIGEISEEDEISDIDEPSKTELKEENDEILEDNDSSVETEEPKETLKEDSEVNENIEENENSDVENKEEEVKENKEEKIINEVPEIDTNIGVSYSGKMYIETPNNGTKITLPDNNTLTLKGWAVSNDDKVVLKAYIDNKYIKNIDKRYKRADVDKTITAYGGTAKTPNAGFQVELGISNLSVGNHTIKIEQVSNTGVIICSETRSIVIAQKVFSGKMNVETPAQTSSYVLPDNKTMQIKGWAVSDDIGAFMLVNIDGKNAQFTTQRVSRLDVDKSISTPYGGTKVTPKAGFILDVDISKLTNGTHDVWVMQVSRYQKIMCETKLKINISPKKYEGKMNIETPNNNTQFTLPDSNNITIRGWAVSDDSNAVLKLYIDNQFKQNIDKRINRNDVNKSVTKYGGTKTTPKAGFEISTDISTLSEGNHTIKIEQVSNQGNVISSETRTIKIKQTVYKGKMNIETPSSMATYNLADTQKMEIKGWAVSDDIGVYMIVDINGKKSNYTTTRNIRADVDKSISPSYGGTKTTPKAGFVLDVDISNLSDGTYDVTVKQVSRYHKILSEKSMKINIKTPNYSGSMYVESPIQNKKYNSSELEIKGWALSNDKNDSIKVYLDGKFITNAERRARQDVLNSYKGKFGGEESNKFPGFYSILNIANLSEGTHIVKIVNCSKFGKEIQSSQVKIMISNTKTWGIDVSHYQDDIDWNTVKNQGINFAILKIGEYRESSGRVIKDSKFDQNYAACKSLGIAVGGYFYSYAFDPTEASHEAAACLSIISGKSFELPIFLDIEDNLIKNAVSTGRTNQANLTNGAITFCNIMNQSGYKSGVYASKNFYQTYLYTSLLENYNIWLAHYTGATNYTGRYDIWQYTSNGSLAGIRGAVDMNWCFRKY